MLRRLCLAVPLLFAGCNQYDIFLLSGYEQSTFSNDADIVFIIDNSDSMTDEAEELAQNFGTFIRDLTTTSEYGQKGLSAAVSDYLLYRRSGQRDRFSTWNHHDIHGRKRSRSSRKRWSEAPTSSRKVSEDVALNFTRSLLCEATCFTNPISSLPFPATSTPATKPIPKCPTPSTKTT